MRKSFSLLALAGLLAAGCGGSDDKKLSPDVISGASGTPMITFEKTDHHFGNVKEGDVLEYSFKFTNTGDGDLLITEAHASCGCTVPRWPEYPIKPGQTDVIPVQFNTTGKKDAQTKTITVTANTTPAETNVAVRAFVIPKDED